jgi:hypothetical protein
VTYFKLYASGKRAVFQTNNIPNTVFVYIVQYLTFLRSLVIIELGGLNPPFPVLKLPVCQSSHVPGTPHTRPSSFKSKICELLCRKIIVPLAKGHDEIQTMQRRLSRSFAKFEKCSSCKFQIATALPFQP